MEIDNDILSLNAIKMMINKMKENVNRYAKVLKEKNTVRPMSILF